MAFDQSTRNRLQKFVSNARAILGEEFTRQLQATYGLDPKQGTVAAIDSLTHLDNRQRQTAHLLRETLAHYLATTPGTSATTKGEKDRTKQVLDRIVREQAFTVLNRLAALRMAEARGFLLESIAKAHSSKGFQLYRQLSGTAHGETGDAYRNYLFSLFDEFSLDLAVLFDRHSAQGRLFPRESALLELLTEINHHEIEHLWAEDETIGWIYQYFNSQEERRAMRDASDTPRDSRELAVRNQFFTPRYVVEFLTDNTLGGIWYEMTQGNTALVDSCRYLVRRPTEIFLKPSETAPVSEASDGEALSQEELLKQPVYIPHRPLKDPRSIRMLDPACGSMHFGLYAFDLFERIYLEAWQLEQQLGPNAFTRETSQQALQSTYESLEVFKQQIPKLIIEHNIYGVDIDPRAVQIAGLSLWQRAQRAWHQQGIKPQQRPTIVKSNIVCAEPMPGEKALLQEFTSKLNPPVLGQLLEVIFDKMQLAGEAGTLLKIEEEIQTAIHEAREQWLKQSGSNSVGDMFQAELDAATPQAKLGFDLRGVDDATFWDDAEQRILQALSDYADQAESNADQKRLFAEDAAKGFAFIDLCRKRFDVLLMNPPFGYPSRNSKDYIDAHYSLEKNDLLAAFVSMGISRIYKNGYVGCIASRTVFYIEYFSKWRSILFNDWHLKHYADLGFGVLDALVETSAFIVSKPKSRTFFPSLFFRLLSERDKELSLCESISTITRNELCGNLYIEHAKEFLKIDGNPMAYWVPSSYRNHFVKNPTTLEAIGEVRVGLQSGDDFRFFRTAWEVEIKQKGLGNIWIPLAKGGEFRKFYDDIYLLVNWAFDGFEIKNFTDEKGKLRSRPQNTACYFRPGLTYPMRTTSNYSPRILPRGCIFNVQGNSIFEKTDSEKILLASLAVLATSTFESFTRLKSRVGDMTSAGGAGFAYTPGLIGSMPFPRLEDKSVEILSGLAKSCVNIERHKDTYVETSNLFVRSALAYQSESLLENFLEFIKEEQNAESDELFLCGEIEIETQKVYKFTQSDAEEVKEQFSVPVAHLPSDSSLDHEALKKLYLSGYDPSNRTVEQATQQREMAKDRHLRLEEICQLAKINPKSFSEIRNVHGWYREEELICQVEKLISYIVGVCFGRWDIRYSTGEYQYPQLPDFFDVLPACPRGLLQNENCLPVESISIPKNYPLSISWSGILMDGEGVGEDIVALSRKVFEVIWKDRAQDIEHEACKILGVRNLREYFQRPAAFFANHLKSYSQSRRQAPIYWPLQSQSASYTLWVYYHRLNEQTLYTCVNDFVEPKLTQVEQDLNGLRSKSARSNQEEKELEKLSDLVSELRDFRDELLRLAKFWKPNLNDGVQITAAPLWKLFQHKAWQKKLKETWESLEKGDYDWAHLACSIWPERVLRKCHQDRSLAIAHDVEAYFWHEVEVPVKRGKKLTGETKLEWQAKDFSEAELTALVKKLAEEVK